MRIRGRDKNPREFLHSIQYPRNEMVTQRMQKAATIEITERNCRSDSSTRCARGRKQRPASARNATGPDSGGDGRAGGGGGVQVTSPEPTRLPFLVVSENLTARAIGPVRCTRHSTFSPRSAIKAALAASARNTYGFENKSIERLRKKRSEMHWDEKISGV